MNSVRALPLVFLLSAMAFPQSSIKHFSSDTLRANCPVELNANLKIAGNTVLTTPAKSEQSTPNKQRLQVILSNPKSEIVGARITIYGFPIGGRVEPAVAYSPHGPSEIAKTIAFDQIVAEGQSGSYEVALPNFGAVASVDLDSLKYSDGSSWHPVGRKSCRAVPVTMNTASADSR